MARTYTKKEMENAVMLAADLYQRLYNADSTPGGSLEVANVIIDEACRMEKWLTDKYGEDDDCYLDRLEEYEDIVLRRYGLRLPDATEPREQDFYSIESDGKGGKLIHVMGFCTCCEDMGDGPWRNVEYTGFIEPLQEFIDRLKVDEDYVGNRASELNQYVGEYTDDGMVDIINQYFNGKTANAELAYSDITMDTPCGDYIC